MDLQLEKQFYKLFLENLIQKEGYILVVMYTELLQILQSAVLMFLTAENEPVLKTHFKQPGGGGGGKA